MVVIGAEIPRVPCTEIEADTLNATDQTGDLILNCNIRGFRANVENTREFINRIKKTSRVKLVGLTELFNCGDCNNYLEDHILLARPRPSNPNRGGVAFLIFNELQYTTPTIENDFIDS